MIVVDVKIEYLSGRPNFRYKKVNVIMGTNATGKTSFGRMLMRLFNFMDTKQYEKITEVISDVHKKALISMDFITDGYVMYRIIVQIAPRSEEKYRSADVRVSLGKTEIGLRDHGEILSLFCRRAG